MFANSIVILILSAFLIYSDAPQWLDACNLGTSTANQTMVQNGKRQHYYVQGSAHQLPKA